MSWMDDTWFALPSDGDAFQIFPTIWQNSACACIGSQKIQRIRDCFLTVLMDANNIRDPQDRIYFAELLYDQTNLPIDIIAFLARLSLWKTIDISNGDAKPIYIKNSGKVQRAVDNISHRLGSK